VPWPASLDVRHASALQVCAFAPALSSRARAEKSAPARKDAQKVAENLEA
jgi:hypothetical protein